MMSQTDLEREISIRWEEAQACADELEQRLSEIYRSGYQPLLDAGDYAGAWNYVNSMPDCTERLFARDAVRCARGDYKDK